MRSINIRGGKKGYKWPEGGKDRASAKGGRAEKNKRKKRAATSRKKRPRLLRMGWERVPQPKGKKAGKTGRAISGEKTGRGISSTGCKLSRHHYPDEKMGRKKRKDSGEEKKRESGGTNAT